MAIQKTYLDEVLETSSYCNRWLQAARNLENHLTDNSTLTYQYIDELSTIECRTPTGERFLIIFSWIDKNGKPDLCINVKTYAKIINAHVMGNIPIAREASAITVAMSISKLIVSIEYEIHAVHRQTRQYNPQEKIRTTSFGTAALGTVLKMLIGIVYFNNFKYDWSTT